MREAWNHWEGAGPRDYIAGSRATDSAEDRKYSLKNCYVVADVYDVVRPEDGCDGCICTEHLQTFFLVIIP